MDEFKPEDELKPDPSDRRTGRTRQSSERDNDPQINFDDVDLEYGRSSSRACAKGAVRKSSTAKTIMNPMMQWMEERVERRPPQT
ncbi:DamX protein [Citrobacter koseri]|uniref:DamX protein n=1 Tax=Citrobacter koseri TaxID=545 RepID=A0A447UM78_CITKO|nr:DamX protein [Citrobacter koseri]